MHSILANNWFWDFLFPGGRGKYHIAEANVLEKNGMTYLAMADAFYSSYVRKLFFLKQLQSSVIKKCLKLGQFNWDWTFRIKYLVWIKVYLCEKVPHQHCTSIRWSGLVFTSIGQGSLLMCLIWWTQTPEDWHENWSSLPLSAVWWDKDILLNQDKIL